MRRGASTTTKALSEQSVASEQVSKESNRLTNEITGVSKAMAEQAAASTQMTAAVLSMRQQGQQLAAALSEQSRAMREMTGASSDIAKNVSLISIANLEHSKNAEHILQMLTDTRRVTDRNINGIKATVSETVGMAEQAEEMAAMMASFDGGTSDATSAVSKTNGAAPKGRKRKMAPDANTGNNGSESE